MNCWKSTTASDDALYAAMDWLFERQDAIETKLAKRHLKNGGRVLYDLSSSYFEGCQCPLAARGYSRDQKKGKLQVNYGLLTDARGCPVAISAFPGNTMDSKTLLDQVERLQTTFGLDSVVLVGDRGMISQKQIDELSGQSGIDWITALRTGAIRKLVTTEAIQLSLFDEHNLFEFTPSLIFQVKNWWLAAILIWRFGVNVPGNRCWTPPSRNWKKSRR